MTPRQAATRLPQLEGSFKKYEALMEEITDDDDYDFRHLEIDNEAVTDAFLNAVTSRKEMTNNHAVNEFMSLNSTVAARSNPSDIKLPIISIPKFNGDELQWTTFYDTFSSLIDQNKSIPKISKMHYLRDSLEGEAFRSISKLPNSDANYEIAWNLLQEQYHNKRLIINNCLKSFIFQDKIDGKNAQTIRSLIDTTKESHPMH